MGILQEDLSKVKRPNVDKTNYGAQYVKVVETNDGTMPVNVTKETKVDTEDGGGGSDAPSTDKSAPKRGGRGKKAK